MADIDPLTAAVARNVRKLRKALGLSAQELSDSMRPGSGLKRSVISNLESGYRGRLTLIELEDFADALHVAEPWMLTQALCGTCLGSPPAGFTCNACGAGSDG